MTVDPEHPPVSSDLHEPKPETQYVFTLRKEGFIYIDPNNNSFFPEGIINSLRGRPIPVSQVITGEEGPRWIGVNPDHIAGTYVDEGSETIAAWWRGFSSRDKDRDGNWCSNRPRLVRFAYWTGDLFEVPAEEEQQQE